MQATDTQSRSRTAVLALATISLSLIACVIAAELALRMLLPQVTMSPRWQYSTAYGLENPPSSVVIHEKPGAWRFTYTINKLGLRGYLPPNGTHARTVFALGDSYTFGAGVNDGDEYPAVLHAALAPDAVVLNLGVGGWGLSQQIRKYFELAPLFRPCVVILQFSANDPFDNALYDVTSTSERGFVFKDIQSNRSAFRNWLSQSRLQKSQLYNLFRTTLYSRLSDPGPRAAASQLQNSEAQTGDVERVYVALLRAFSDTLTERGIALSFIAVNGQLTQFPKIHDAVMDLDTSGRLTYLEVLDWFGETPPPKSPEGHAWGQAAHEVIGTELARRIRPLLAREACSTLPVGTGLRP